MAETNTKAVMKEEHTHNTQPTRQRDRARPGLKFPRYFTRTGVSAVRRSGMGAAHRQHH